MQELEKILEEIKAHRNFASECGNFNVASAFELCVEIIRKHMNDGWISVEDLLPEDDVDVLVTYADIDDEEYADITTTTYGNAYLGGNKLDFKEWRSPFEYFKSNYKVTAWQYLPEPYRPERNSEE